MLNIVVAVIVPVVLAVVIIYRSLFLPPHIAHGDCCSAHLHRRLYQLVMLVLVVGRVDVLLRVLDTLAHLDILLLLGG